MVSVLERESGRRPGKHSATDVADLAASSSGAARRHGTAVSRAAHERQRHAFGQLLRAAEPAERTADRPGSNAAALLDALANVDEHQLAGLRRLPNLGGL